MPWRSQNEGRDPLHNGCIHLLYRGIGYYIGYRFARNTSSGGVHLDSMEEIECVNIRNDDLESSLSNGLRNSGP